MSAHTNPAPFTSTGPNWKETVAILRAAGETFRLSVGGGVLRVMVNDLNVQHTTGGRAFAAPVESFDELIATTSVSSVSWSAGLSVARGGGGMVVEVFAGKESRGRAELSSTGGTVGRRPEVVAPVAAEPAPVDFTGEENAADATELQRIAAEIGNESVLRRLTDGMSDPDTAAQLTAVWTASRAPVVPPVVEVVPEVVEAPPSLFAAVAPSEGEIIEALSTAELNGDSLKGKAVAACAERNVSITWAEDGTGKGTILSITLTAPAGFTFADGEAVAVLPRDAKGAKSLWRRAKATAESLTAQRALRLVRSGDPTTPSEFLAHIGGILRGRR